MYFITNLYTISFFTYILKFVYESVVTSIVISVIDFRPLLGLHIVVYLFVLHM